MIPEDEASRRDVERRRALDRLAREVEEAGLYFPPAILGEEARAAVAETLLATGSGDNDRVRMRQILEIQEHVPVPPTMHAE